MIGATAFGPYAPSDDHPRELRSLPKATRRNRAVFIQRDLQLLLGQIPRRYPSASRRHRLEHANNGLGAGEEDVMHVSIHVGVLLRRE
eukprot:6182227-Pleurochrysis_carterae.AAC.1